MLDDVLSQDKQSDTHEHNEMIRLAHYKPRFYTVIPILYWSSFSLRSPKPRNFAWTLIVFSRDTNLLPCSDFLILFKAFKVMLNLLQKSKSHLHPTNVICLLGLWCSVVLQKFRFEGSCLKNVL